MNGGQGAGVSHGKAVLACLKPAAGFTNLGPRGFLDRPLRILALSGGGANGAFGAGVIKGWYANPALNPAPLSEIDIITGVSTGAVQALFLAAARGAADPDKIINQLASDYCATNDRRIFSNRWPGWLLPLAMFVRMSRSEVRPLRQRLTALVSTHLPDLRAAIAGGLQVYFGAVMLEDGGLYAASLGDLLQLADPVPAIVDIVLASSAVPVDYPPVEIGGRLFIDGGVRHTSFICEIVWKLLDQFPEGGTLDVLLIRNGTNSPNGCSRCDKAPTTAAESPDCISATGKPTRPTNLYGLLIRAINEIMTNQIELASQYRIAGDLALIAQRKGIETSFWMSHLTNIDLERRGIRRPEGAIFDRAYMQKILAFGEERAAWDHASCLNPRPNEEHRGAFMRIKGPGVAFDDTVPIETRRCA